MADNFKDLDNGWSWIVMLTCFASSFVIGGTNFSVGLIHTTVLEMFHENQVTTSWVGGLHTSITYLAAPLSSFLIDRYSTRTALVISGILYAIGFFSTAFAPSIGVAMLTCGIIAGFGAAIGLTASMCALGFYFRRYRNLAQGFNLSGTGVGIFGLAPAMQISREVYGTGGFFIILACITVHLIVFGTTMRPSQLEIHSQQKRLENINNSIKNEKQNNLKSPFLSLVITYFKVFTTKSITCLSLSMLLYCLGIYVIFMYLPNYCVHQGVSQMQASFVLSACGGASIFGRLCTGLVGNFEKISEIYLYSGSMLVLALATGLFPLFAQEYPGQIVYAVILGMTFGSPFVTITPINISFVGVSNMAAALGIELCLGGIGAIVGPVIGGSTLDNGGTYEHTFIIAGVAIFVAAVFGIVPSFLSAGNQHEDKPTADRDIIINESRELHALLDTQEDQKTQKTLNMMK